MAEVDEQEALKKELVEVKANFYEYVKTVIRQSPDMRKHYGCSNLEQWIKFQVDNTAKKIEKLISDFEKKWPE